MLVYRLPKLNKVLAAAVCHTTGNVAIATGSVIQCAITISCT